MDESRIVVDTASINKLLNELSFSNQEATKAVRAALRDSANIIRRSVYSRIPGTDKQLRQGVSVNVYRNVSGVRIDLFKSFWWDYEKKLKGENKKVRKGFTLRWLELGTKAAGRHRATQARHFFASAVASSQKEASDRLTEFIIKRINKIAAKR